MEEGKEGMDLILSHAEAVEGGNTTRFTSLLNSAPALQHLHSNL